MLPRNDICFPSSGVICKYATVYVHNLEVSSILLKYLPSLSRFPVTCCDNTQVRVFNLALLRDVKYNTDIIV